MAAVLRRCGSARLNTNRRHNRAITLPDEDYDYFRKLGTSASCPQGNASKGMSVAVALLKKQQREKAK